MSTLREKYTESIVPQLREELEITNPCGVPRVEKVVVNMGMGSQDKDAFQSGVESLARISGQKPQIRKARKSISNFKLREGMQVGAKVTLRRRRMYEFLERLIHAALPRIRDFRGLSCTGFDGRGNYSMGIRELTIFPEINKLTEGRFTHIQFKNITV